MSARTTTRWHAVTHTLAEQAAGQLSWAATTIGMAFHSLLGGVALAAAVAAEAGGHSGLVGLGTALVIILHKPFDAMTVSTLMAASGCSRFSRHVLNGLFALATPLGAILFYAGASELVGSNPVFLGGALAFCAGTFLCIACADLLPELQFHSHDRLKLSVALAAGLAVAVLIGQFETLRPRSRSRSVSGRLWAEAAGLRSVTRQAATEQLRRFTDNRPHEYECRPRRQITVSLSGPPASEVRNTFDRGGFRAR